MEDDDLIILFGLKNFLVCVIVFRYIWGCECTVDKNDIDR